MPETLPLREADIRNASAHGRYLELVRADAEALAREGDAFTRTACPACGASAAREAFVKLGFHYVDCEVCDTLYVNPRPSFERLTQLYVESPSTRYWVEEFFKPVAEARRVKIFRPRAEHLASTLSQGARGRVGDIGAGFGLFLEELRPLWADAELVAIEPSEDMAAIAREKGFPVIEAMLEDIPADAPRFDVLTAFELFEHLHDPAAFLRTVRELLVPGGHFVMTTLNGLGFDIRVLWEQSRAVSPPHHLNFINPASARRLFERCGFEIVEIATPGVLDWDIVEGTYARGEAAPDRFFDVVRRHGTPAAKRDLQTWITTHGFSSHLRVVARRSVRHD